MFVFKPVMPTHVGCWFLVCVFCLFCFSEGHVYVDFNEPDTEPKGENDENDDFKKGNILREISS